MSNLHWKLLKLPGLWKEKNHNFFFHRPRPFQFSLTTSFVQDRKGKTRTGAVMWANPTYIIILYHHYFTLLVPYQWRLCLKSTDYLFCLNLSMYVHIMTACQMEPVTALNLPLICEVLRQNFVAVEHVWVSTLKKINFLYML